MRSSALALSLALALPAAAQSPAFLVKDVNVQPPPPVNAFEPPFTDLYVAGDVAYFAANAEEIGPRLWVTDGTEGGTHPFASPSPVSGEDFTPGAGTTYFRLGMSLWKTDGTSEGTVRVAGGGAGYAFSVLNTVGAVGAQAAGGFVFSGDDGAGGRGLWRTDGTPGDAELIRAFTTPSSVATPNFFRAVGGTAFFVANDGVIGRELWRTDGTAAGTALVADLAPGSASGLPQELTVIGSELWFNAETAVGRELYKTDGTEAGTVLVKDTRNPGSGAPTEITLAGTTVFFTVDGATGKELWKSDGTDPGTTLVASFPTGSFSVRSLEPLGSEVLFSAHTNELGYELWKSDGTTTQLVRDIVPGAGEAGPGSLMRVGEYIFFGGGSGASDGLWRTDGTEAGTIFLADVDATPLAGIGETLLFRGVTDTYGRELWRSDGTPAGTTIVKNIAKETSSGLDSGAVLNHWGRVDLAGTLILDASDGVNGEKMWRSDGTSEGTVVVTDAVNQGTGYWVMGAHAYFPGRPDPEPNPSAAQGLWRTDGTAAGTELVHSVSPSSSPDGTARGLDLGGVLLFAGNTTANGIELWRSDGTAAGTFLVEDLAPGSTSPPFPQIPRPYSSVPLEFTKVGTVAFLTAIPDPGTVPSVRKLFRTDGTEAGTFVVDPPGGLSAPSDLVDVVGVLYFIAKDSLGASRLWRSDGTAAGTVVVPIPLVAGDTPSVPVALGSALLYSARAPSGAVGVWRTDGTSAGTSLLIELPSPPTTVVKLHRLGSRVIFSGFSAEAGGSRLFVTDGTAAGTGLLKTTGIVPEGASEHLTVGNRLVFASCDPAAGCEPWATDGTDGGTRRLADVGPGSDSSFPRGFVRSGDFVYFTAYDSRGRELWAIPMSALTLKACEDGWDNDGDGSVDAADPGCGAPTAPTESPQCNDGVDNDGDSAVDLADPNCGGQAWRKESPGCGLLGIEGVVFAAAVFARRGVLARRRARSV